jgi:hypothetical protein
MKKKLLFAMLLMLAPISASATWSLVQHPTNTSCAASTTCAVTLSSTTAGQLAVFTAAGLPNATHISTVTAALGTFVDCSNCNSHPDTSGDNIDQGYILSINGSQTTVTITLSTAATGTWFASVDIYSSTLGTAVFDVSGSTADASCTSCAGQALTLTGANDVIVQGTSTLGTVSAIASPYTNPNDAVAALCAGAINQSAGTAPTWTQSASTMAVSAMAFKEASGGSTPVPTRMLLGVGT